MQLLLYQFTFELTDCFKELLDTSDGRVSKQESSGHICPRLLLPFCLLKPKSKLSVSFDRPLSFHDVS